MNALHSTSKVIPTLVAHVCHSKGLLTITVIFEKVCVIHVFFVSVMSNKYSESLTISQWDVEMCETFSVVFMISAKE